MAKPIKHTPVLTGKDAVNFWNVIENNSNKKVDESVLISIRQNADKLKNIFRK